MSFGAHFALVASCVAAFWWPYAFNKVLKLLESLGQIGWSAGVAVAAAIVASSIASVLQRQQASGTE